MCRHHDHRHDARWYDHAGYDNLSGRRWLRRRGDNYDRLLGDLNEHGIDYVFDHAYIVHADDHERGRRDGDLDQHRHDAEAAEGRAAADREAEEADA